MKPVSLYLHVPFCVRKCPYCCFYHVAHSPALEAEYIDAACGEIRSIPDQIGFQPYLPTIYFGGGTPSLLSNASLDMLRGALDPFLPGEKPAEFTVELNPEDVNAPLLAHLKSIDVNRISLGVQSMDTDAQKILRRCPPRSNERALSLLRGGFDNINVDVLAGIPGCAQEGLRDTMETLCSYAPEHFSIYCLEQSEGEEPNSATFFDGVDPGRCADGYLFVCAFLKERGYRHYEVSNFSVPAKESLHNLVYWSGGEYVGIGPAAHSFIGGKRYCNPPSLRSYLDCAARGEIRDRIEDSDESDPMLEKIMLALRTDRGMPMEWAGGGSRLVAELVERSLAAICGGRLILTDRGFLLLDEIILRIRDERPNGAGTGRFLPGRSGGRGLDSRSFCR